MVKTAKSTLFAHRSKAAVMKGTLQLQANKNFIQGFSDIVVIVWIKQYASVHVKLILPNPPKMYASNPKDVTASELKKDAANFVRANKFAKTKNHQRK